MSRTHLCGAAGIGLLTVLWLGGCASGQMNRIDSHRDIYETWPLETKQAVLDGKVEPGMNSDMVTVAWGKPSEVQSNGNGDEVWVYKRGGEDPSMGSYPGTYPSGSTIGGYPGTSSSIGMGGGSMGGSNTIGIGMGRGGTSVISSSSIGTGIGIGGGGMGSPIMRRPDPVEVREVVFRNGVVLRADEPPDAKEKP